MNYDPRLDFWKKAIDFLFKQSPAIVICVIVCWLMWQRMERKETESELRIDRLNEKWDVALSNARRELAMCEEKRQALEVKFAVLSEKVARMSRRVKN
ncbi:MAG: hypothetical protein KDC70_00175 [Saprospiraceae bacterium]|nr:hypothetical protein [Saprospiraceae bacterium]